jgi:hypothetical protein
VREASKTLPTSLRNLRKHAARLAVEKPRSAIAGLVCDLDAKLGLLTATNRAPTKVHLIRDFEREISHGLPFFNHLSAISHCHPSRTT